MSIRDSRSDAVLSDDARGKGDPMEAASFIAETVTELALLARRHHLDMVAHLLDMAQLEADDVIRQQMRTGKF